MAELVVDKLNKRFRDVSAVSDVSFTVADGEFVTLLGPSGCGKSTTLAAIAGLDQPTAGRIAAGSTVFFDGDKGVFLPAERRNCGLVFQSYALWPHLTVAQNVAFPLKLRGVTKAEQDRLIRQVLDLVEMVPLMERYPHELSGGQQQRVALARTLVYKPSVLLLDEPLSNLDAKLRERARVWLGQLKDQVRLTTIYVTHDQIEALALSDRIVIMNKGRIVQIGTPREIYENPADPFVADFIGTSSFFAGTHAGPSASGAGCTVQLPSGLRIDAMVPRKIANGSQVTVAVRPERIHLCVNGKPPVEEPGALLPGSIANRSYMGARFQYEVLVGDVTVKVEAAEIGDVREVSLWVPEAAAIAFAA